MKRTLAALFAACLAVSFFTGCQKKNEVTETKEEEPVKLTVYWWGNQLRNERTQAVLDMYAKDNPKVSFDPQFAEWADYWNKLATSAAGHQMPDVIQMDYQFLYQYAAKNLLVDLNPYMQSGKLDTSKFSQGVLMSGSVDGKVYAIVNGVNAPSLLYNKTLLEENGIAIKDNMTIEEFIDVAKAVYKKTGVKTNFAYNSNGYQVVEYIMRGMGYPSLYGDKKFVVESADKFEGYFGIYERGINEGWLISPSIFSERTLGSVEQHPLVYGDSPDTRSWCAFVWSNQIAAYNKAKPEGMEIGITTWPSEDCKKADYLKPSQFFSVSVDSKNPDEAVALINFLSNSVECNNVLLAERGVPPASNVADAIAPKLDNIQQNVINFINNVVTPNSSAISAPAPAENAQVVELLFNLQEQICYKKATAKQAAQELFTKGNAILAQ